MCTKGMREHPSGRPVRRRIVVERQNLRIPHDEPLTPRLRVPDRLTYAVGFPTTPAHTDDD